MGLWAVHSDFGNETPNIRVQTVEIIFFLSQKSREFMPLSK